MKIVFAKRKPNPYTSRNGNTTYVYEVKGTPEELAAYKKSKGENYREDKDSKEPLFFTTNVVGNSAELVENSKGEFIADMTKEKIFSGLECQYGTTIAREKIAEMNLN
jgi:hypothetical protein